MAESLKFVETLVAASIVRLDLNDGSIWTLTGIEYPAPPMERSLSESMLRDGGLVAASAYRNRTILVSLFLSAGNQDAWAAQLSLLAVELNRENNLLRFVSKSATDPVFFRTFRSPSFDPSDYPYQDGKGTVDLTILAEPFAYGLLESFAAVVVASDPEGANGMYLDVDGVLGDVDTPAMIQIDEPDVDVPFHVMAVRRHGVPADLAFFVQAEDMNLDTDAAVVADVLASGNALVEVDFGADPSMRDRVSMNAWPKVLAPTSAERRAAVGSYNVYAVVKKNASATQIAMRVRSGAVLGETVTLPITSDRVFVFLGTVQNPHGQLVAGPGYSNQTPGARDLDFAIQAEQVLGSGHIKIDFVCWLPNDEATCVMDWGYSTADLWYDGPNDATYLASDGWLVLNATAYGGPETTLGFKRAGGIPSLVPNQTNRIYLAFGARSALDNISQVFAKTDVMNVVVHYWPRFLIVR